MTAIRLNPRLARWFSAALLMAVMVHGIHLHAKASEKQTTSSKQKTSDQMEAGTKFKYCPDLRTMAAEVIEYEIRGFEFLFSLASCRDRSIFKYFNPGDEEPVGDGLEDEPMPEYIAADPAKPYEIMSIRSAGEEEFDVEFDVFSTDKKGKTRRTRGSLGFVVLDTPAAKDPDNGCVMYLRPPEKTFIRKDCIDPKYSTRGKKRR